VEKIAFIPDPHRPYHSKPAWELFLASMKDWKPDTLVIHGDWADFYKVSRFSKDPRRQLSFAEEVESCRDGLKELSSLSSVTRRIFVEGNHENRLAAYLADKAPDLFEFVSVPDLLKLDEYGWEFVPYKDSIQLGKLWITHDAGFIGRYAVYRTADTFQHSVVTAHTHRMCYIVEGNATGEHFVAASFGWMGDVDQVDYMHKVKAKRDWTLGFGTGLLDNETDIVYLTPHPIINSGSTHSVVVNGKEYRA
jgi:predicted phosphodiesterase